MKQRVIDQAPGLTVEGITYELDAALARLESPLGYVDDRGRLADRRLAERLIHRRNLLTRKR